MERSAVTVAMIGFGEAAQAFAVDAPRRAYDRKTDSPATRGAKLAEYAACGVERADTVADALHGAHLALSLVTADQALAAAQGAARHVGSGTLYLDGNSVAPETKRRAAAAIEAGGGRYVDLAIMAPVHPARLAVPLLVSGPHMKAAAETLRMLGFTNVAMAGDGVGRASSIKMIRSVMVKGMEALSAEMAFAAKAAGVLDEVLASLDASERPAPWADRIEYALERMTRHGLRRAAEMEEVVRTLNHLGTGSAMSRGTVLRQRELGEAGQAGITERKIA